MDVGGDDQHAVDGSLSEDHDDTSTTSSDDNSDVDIDPRDAELMMSLEAALDANPNSYDKHVEYIDILRKAKLRERLRAAYKRMSALFPLSEQLWTAWVNSELEQVKDLEDIQRIQELFQNAVQDYLSVNLWASYLEFVSEFDPEVSEKSQAGIQKMRELCEAALTAAGLHLSEGARLWSIFRQFELSLEAAGLGGDKQDKVRSLYHRQLQVPLAGALAVMEEYKAWEAQHGKAVPPHILQAHAKAEQAVQLRQPYEQAVAPNKPADAVLLAAYMSYIKLEQAQGDPARVQVLYERAITVFPVTHELWLQYGKYLEGHLQIAAVTHAVYARAVRNCYWVGVLWARTIRALDRFNGSLEDQQAVYERAIQAGMQGPEDYMEVLLAHLDALRHHVAARPGTPEEPCSATLRLREAFQAALNLMASYFPEYLDRSLRLLSYWAHVEAHVLGDIAAARQVWEDALKSGLSKCCEVWAAYANMERGLRNIRQARGVFRKAYSRRMEEGGQLTLCMDWLRFEREEGSAEDLFQATLKVEPILEEAAAASAAAADAQAAAMAKAAVQQAPKLSKEEVRRLRQQHDPNFRAPKEAQQGKGGKKDKKAAQAAAQDEPFAEEEAGAGKKAAAAAAPSHKAAAAALGAVGKARGRDDAAAAAGAAAGKGTNKRLRDADDARTSQHAEGEDQETEAKRAKTHGTQPAAPDSKTAQPHAAAHVAMHEDQPEMSHDDARTLQQRATLDASAATSVVSAEGEKQKFKGFRDVNTVFVKGFQPDVRNEDVEALFKPLRGFESLRLMREPDTGRFRGFAYVEFASASGMQEAINALNNTEFQGRTLYVAKSAPPGTGSRGGGRGGARGGGHGGVGRGGGGRGRGEQHGWGAEHGDAGGGRGGGFVGHGMHGGSGGRGGRGGPGSDAAAGGRGMKQHLDLGQGRSSKAPPTVFMPRSVAAQAAAPKQGAAQPQSNEDFRKMLLKK